MNQIVKDKMAREIMVVKADVLFKSYLRETRFYPNSEFDFQDIILKNYEYIVRGEAENDLSYKQPITYSVVINEKNEIFVYKRGGNGSNAGESRLHSKIAFGVGGHIERENEIAENPILDCLKKEIKEELNFDHKDIISIEPIGYINGEIIEVDKYHIGVAYLIKVHNSNFELLDGELETGEFISLEKLEEMIKSPDYNIENWSKILFEPIKFILK